MDYLFLDQHDNQTASIFKLTLRNTILIEKLLVPQLAKKFSAFYETWMFIPCTHNPATGHCPELDESNPQFPTRFI
jgi:hypothetical protein